MSALADPAVTVPQVDVPPRSFARAIVRRPLGVAAITFLVVLVVVSIAAPLVAPDKPSAQNLGAVLTGPTAHHLLGTDTLGRDVLSRLIYGGRRSLLSIAEGLAAVLLLGIPLGLAAGYAGGWVDRILSRLGEMVMAIPAIILILVVLAVVPDNENVAMLVFGLLGAPTMMRVVRGATLQIREELYIKAARLAGLSHLRIVTRHVLRRVKGPIIVQASLFAAYALLFETGIAYLGLTGDTTTPTWGGMVADASTVIQQQSWLLFPPGILIALTILALGVLGNTARDILVNDQASAIGRRRIRRDPHRPHSGSHDPGIVIDSGALLVVSGLSVERADRAQRATPVVDRVAFTVAAGETVGLVGESGCGKSVTALALLRLLPTGLGMSAGSVVWDGADISAVSEREFDRLRGTQIAYVSQEPQSSLDPTFTVLSQLIEVIRHHERVSRPAARTRALELLSMVELPNPEQVARSRAHELSGGMAQRVAIAIALAGRPRLLIADEPTTALDVTVQAEILSLLRRLQAETGMAMLLITHNWGVVADICDRTLVMYAGQIVEESPVQAMFDQPLHPYTQGLLASHPSLAAAHSRLAALAGSVPAPGTWPHGCRFAPRCPHAIEECRAEPVELVHVHDDRASRCVRVEDLFAAEVSA